MWFTLTGALIAICCPLAAVIFGRPPFLHFAGIAVQTASGTPASRWRCTLRSVAASAVFLALFMIAWPTPLIGWVFPATRWSHAAFAVGVLWTVACGYFSIQMPELGI